MSNLLAVTNSPEKIQLSRIAHVYQRHVDLESWVQFAKDFGFVEAARIKDTVYYRGYGKDPYCLVCCRSNSGKREFGGAAFVARTQADFDKAKLLPGATVTDISHAPGGGTMVSIPTPTNNLFHVIWGQSEREDAEAPPRTTDAGVDKTAWFNTSLQKRRHGE